MRGAGPGREGGGGVEVTPHVQTLVRLYWKLITIDHELISGERGTVRRTQAARGAGHAFVSKEKLLLYL